MADRVPEEQSGARLAVAIGGYQVFKKWLSYHERGVLGRSLTSDEVRLVTDVARRIAAILLLEPRLDANYNAITASTYQWSRSEKAQNAPAQFHREK